MMEKHIDDKRMPEQDCDEVTRNLMMRMGCSPNTAELCGRAVAVQARGDVCLGPLNDDELVALRNVPGIGIPGKKQLLPFVLDGNMLYTRRNWQYEQNIRTHVRKMAVKCGNVDVPTDGPFEAMEMCQREAVAIMCNYRLSILTGGPGTGKTYTIARAVKLIQATWGDKLKLGLAAPTGKAAARVREAMTKEADALGLVNIPSVLTIHSLLKPNHDFVSFKHNCDNPLDLHWLIVDEASMIDMPLMSKLLDALPKDCRLTLVGDAHQLASVEPGRIFSDLCKMAELPKCELNVSRRFESGGEIDRLATAVNNGEGDVVVNLLKEKSLTKIHYEEIPANQAHSPQKWGNFKTRIEELFLTFAEQQTSEGALAKLNACRVLCALRNGPFGINAMNRFIKNTLETRLDAKIPIPTMITKNDHNLAVSNGDVGVIMPDRESRDSLYLYDETDKTIRKIRQELLPDRETAFASTVHKAQGSEYEDVIVVLPPLHDDDSENIRSLLTREILYTAITRTKGKVYLYATDDAIRHCCTHAVERCTGLANGNNEY